MAETGLKSIYVGGFGEDMTDQVLFNAFSTFGDIISVQLPQDPSKRIEDGHVHRGFGFIEFSTPSEALDAVDNMHSNELNGRVLKVNLAKPKSGGSALGTNRSVWQNEEWLKEHSKPLGEGGADEEMTTAN